jgi:hypothetical protein
MRTRMRRSCERAGSGWRRGARGCAGAALGEDLPGGALALAAAGRDPEAVAELVESPRPELRALANLVVGDGVADTDIHR